MAELTHGPGLAKDSECVAVVNGCCSVGNGNPGIGIRRDMVRAFERNLHCKQDVCTGMAVLGLGEAVARCKEGKCWFNGLM